MGKRYYCDFCDKSFPDSIDGRKKHNSGIAHQRLKESHYSLFAGSRLKLDAELAKGPCRRFIQGMECRFGPDCRFSHLRPHELDALRLAAYSEECEYLRLPSQLLTKNEPNIIEFVEKIERLTENQQK